MSSYMYKLVLLMHSTFFTRLLYYISPEIFRRYTPLFAERQIHIHVQTLKCIILFFQFNLFDKLEFIMS